MLRELAATRTPTATEVATAATAMAVTEAFYHFHSFTLELAGFALTWAILRGAVGLAGKARRRSP